MLGGLHARLCHAFLVSLTSRRQRSCKNAAGAKVQRVVMKAERTQNRSTASVHYTVRWCSLKAGAHTVLSYLRHL